MTIERLIEQLYDGALDPSAWDRAVLGIADLVRASGAMLFAFDPQTGVMLRGESHRVDPLYVADYARHWHREDLRIAHVLPVPVGQPVTEESLRIPVTTSRIYHEFLLKADTPYFMPAWLHKTARKYAALSLQGTLKRGPFSAQDIQLLKRFLPHVARALSIRDRLEAADVRLANLSSVLDVAPFGVIMLDENLKILEANAVAATLLRTKAGLCSERGGILQVTDSGSDRLGAWLKRTAISQDDADALLKVSRAGQLPLSLLAVPIGRETASRLTDDPVWLILLFDAERELTLSIPVIAKDLGLSECEARVAALLARGLTLFEAAEHMRVSIHTIRSQLHAAFRKTGCHSQADLVRRILLGPGFVGSHLRLERGEHVETRRV